MQCKYIQYNKYLQISMSDLKGQLVENKQSKDEQFEVLEQCPASNIKQQPKQSSVEPIIKKQQPTGHLIQDQLLKQDKQRNSNLCTSTKCSRCLQLEEELAIANQDKETLKDNFTQLSIQLETLRKSEKKRKESSVEKTELNFAVDSLKEIIKTYEEENQRLSKFIYETMNITPKEGSNKSAVKVVESVVTDFRTNWFEINKELSDLLVLSSPSGQGEEPKQQLVTYNYYETSAKIQKIRQNVLKLLKSQE